MQVTKRRSPGWSPEGLCLLHPRAQLGLSTKLQAPWRGEWGGSTTSPRAFHHPHPPRAVPSGRGSHQGAVGGPWQSCLWSLRWAPRSPARSLRSRTTWRLRSDRPGRSLRRGRGSAELGTQCRNPGTCPRDQRGEPETAPRPAASWLSVAISVPRKLDGYAF